MEIPYVAWDTQPNWRHESRWEKGIWGGGQGFHPCVAMGRPQIELFPRELRRGLILLSYYRAQRHFR